MKNVIFIFLLILPILSCKKIQDPVKFDTTEEFQSGLDFDKNEIEILDSSFKKDLRDERGVIRVKTTSIPNYTHYAETDCKCDGPIVIEKNKRFFKFPRNDGKWSYFWLRNLEEEFLLSYYCMDDCELKPLSYAFDEAKSFAFKWSQNGGARGKWALGPSNSWKRLFDIKYCKIRNGFKVTFNSRGKGPNKSSTAILIDKDDWKW